MATKPKAKKTSEFTRGFHSESYNKIELLFKEFYEERRRGDKGKFHEAVAYPVIDILKNIAASEDLDTEEKLSTLAHVYTAAADMANQLRQPELSIVFWEDRPMSERNADPFQWVKEHYPSYGADLHQGHIYNHDRSLYRRLHDEKPWPDDFILPTRAEANDRLLEAAGRSPTLKEIADAAPPNIREMIRLHELARARKRKRAPRQS
jgi:hypothetical protein